MNILRKTTITMALTAVAAFANDHLVQIRDHAKQLEQDFRGLHAAAKERKFDAINVEARVTAAGAGVEKLKALIADFETATPHLASGEDWKATRDLVALIDIFHSEKAQLLGPNLSRQRGLFKAHAEGLAKRAALLQQSTGRMLRTLGS